jgi:DNA-binding response OmpR family regulator
MPIAGLQEQKKKRILYVEDDSDSRDMIRVLLKDHELKMAATLTRGLELARDALFDLYVIDGTFEDGTGVALCQQLRVFDSSTPIIFFTGLAGTSNLQEAMHAGAQAYLIKPNDIDKLERMVSALLLEDTP